MSIHRLFALTSKEFRHIVRDARTFFLVTVAPAFLLVTLSYVFAFDVERVDIAICDLDQTPISRHLLAGLTADGDVVIVQTVEHQEEVEPLFAQEMADALLVIPPGFSEALLSREPPVLHLIVDGADAIIANQAIGLLESRMQAVVADSLARYATSLQPTNVTFELSTRVWYNGALDSLISMVPGMMALILCMPALALALALAREVEMGSFESLIATPMRGIEYLWGKMLAYQITGLLSVVLAWLVATVWFRVPFRGNLGVFLVLSSVYLFASMGISLLIGNAVRNQQTAMFLILMIFFVPSFFIAGLILPVSNHPISRWVAQLLPTTHFIVVARAVFLKGLGPAALSQPLLALLGIAGVCHVLSWRLFKNKL